MLQIFYLELNAYSNSLILIGCFYISLRDIITSTQQAESQILFSQSDSGMVGYQLKLSTIVVGLSPSILPSHLSLKLELNIQPTFRQLSGRGSIRGRSRGQTSIPVKDNGGLELLIIRDQRNILLEIKFIGKEPAEHFTLRRNNLISQDRELQTRSQKSFQR